jgi:thiamine pyrophosphate-dependent acetolactate synthase large subunit-like protein
MRELLRDYLDGRLSRRGFLERLVATGFTMAAARSIVEGANVEAAPAAADVRYPVVTGTGGDLLAEQVKAAGTRFVFTNPGSFEVGFFDALTDRPELQVIVGLHEGIVIPMADGYHKVTQRPAFVNVHAVAGTAQMAGQLYNAHRDGSAIVVTAASLDNTLYSDEIRLGARPGFSQTEINRQFTKISWEVKNAQSIPVFARRAFKTASTPPGGPVYVCFARGALETPNVKAEVWPAETFSIQARPRPSRDAAESLAKYLIEAERPIAVFGDEIWKSGAQAEAVAFAEMLGLAAAAPGPIGRTAALAFVNFPVQHPQFVGEYLVAKPFGAAKVDLAVQLGTRGDMGELDLPQEPSDPSVKMVAVGIDTAMLGRTRPLDLAVVGDVREALRDVMEAVKSMATPARLQKLRTDRLAAVKPYAASLLASVRDNAKKNFDHAPIHPDRLGYEMDQALDPDAIIVAENLTGQNGLFRLGYRPDEKFWLSNAGDSLGWGVGAAIGAKLGAPDRQVVLSIGDGAVMYSASGFWTMVRYGVPVLTVVWNNYNYQAVRNVFERYNKRMLGTGQYHGMYLGDPEIDFVKLAESQGVRGEKVTAAGDIKAALRRGIQATRDGQPYLVEVVVSRLGPGADSTWHQKFSLAAERNKKV